MGLVSCTRCGHSVSERGVKCPRCGALLPFWIDENRQKKKRQKRKHITIWIGVAVVAACIVVYLCIPKGNAEMAEDYYASGMELFECGKYEEAVQNLGVAADEGHADAQFRLAECYYDGYGVKLDHREAVKWYKMAARKGHAEAQFCLGNCYYKGDGVEQNTDKAVRWYKQAAEQGHEEAVVAIVRAASEGNEYAIAIIAKTVWVWLWDIVHKWDVWFS